MHGQQSLQHYSYMWSPRPRALYTLMCKVKYKDHRIMQKQAHTLETHGSELSQSLPLPDRQRPAMVSQTGRLLGQQCWWSSQQVAACATGHSTSQLSRIVVL